MENNLIFKPRSSQLFKVMTKPKNKTDLISKTCQEYLQEYYLEKKYGIKKEIQSRYIDKGNECEELSINLMSIYFNDVFEKNDVFFENDFITGTPDVIKDNIVYDVKTSWSALTFPFFETEPPKQYYYQAQSYLWLSNLSDFKLCYCLINTPEDIIQDEIRRFCWKNNIIDCPSEIESEIRENHIMNKIPLEKRIKLFEIKRNDLVIEDIKKQIEVCRKYINLNLI